jgi:transposase
VIGGGVKMSAIIRQHDKRIGVTYAYESTSYWDKEKKQSRSRRKLIGIIDPETDEIKPTTKKKRNTAIPAETPSLKESMMPLEESPWLYAKRTFYGATYLLDKIGESTGVADDLKVCFPDTYKQILSIAYYLILEDKNPLSRFPKWGYLHTHPYEQIISSQQSSSLFSGISESQRLHFFRLQCKRRLDNEYWAYDTTSISSYSKELRQVRYGKNKDGDSLPQINLAVLFGEGSLLPFYYKKLAGNITDVATVKQLLKDMEFLGYKKVKMVMDRGFYKERNINDLYTEHIKFLMGAKPSLKFIGSEVDKVRDAIRSWENFLPDDEAYGITIPIQWSYKRKRPYKQDEIQENRRMYVHIYYDTIKALEDEQQFTKLVYQLNSELMIGNREKEHEAMYAKYFNVKTTPVRGTKVTIKDDVVANAKKNFGYFALIGNDTIDASQALLLYRNKDAVEKAFDNVKDRLDMRRMNVSSDLSLDGKLFVEFIALIYISYLHKAMLDAHLYAKFTMHELLDEFEVIERFEREGYAPQLGETTKKQRDLFEALNFDPPKSSLC